MKLQRATSQCRDPLKPVSKCRGLFVAAVFVFVLRFGLVIEELEETSPFFKLVHRYLEVGLILDLMAFGPRWINNGFDTAPHSLCQIC